MTAATMAGTPLLLGVDPLPEPRDVTPLPRMVRDAGLAAVPFATTASFSPPPIDSVVGALERVLTTRIDQSQMGDLLPFLTVRSTAQASTSVQASRSTNQQALAQRAVRAVEDLAQWLSVSEETVADIGGFSRRSTSKWRSGQGVYGSTVRSLFETHALVGSLISALGRRDANSWLAANGIDVATLASEEGRRQALVAAQSVLFERPSHPSLIEDEDSDELVPSPAGRSHEFTEGRGYSRRAPS